MKPRPSLEGVTITTPRVALFMQLLGGAKVKGSIALSHDEMTAINKLYGLTPEGPNKKPPPPTPPVRADYADPWRYDEAVRTHERRVKAHNNWKDPQAFMQAGADRNAFRHAEADGLRIVAWLARRVPAGEDPLKTVIQMAVDAGFDVDPEDVSYAED